MKTVDIKGKAYIEVNERVIFFRENYPDYSLISEIVSCTDDKVVFKAYIKDPTGNVLATGHAYEIQGSSFINKTSYIENCETSAWGRCLGNFGIGIDTSIASAEEVQNAIKNQDVKFISEKQLSEITDLINATETDIPKFLKHFGFESLEKISTDIYKKATSALKEKLAKMRENNDSS